MKKYLIGVVGQSNELGSGPANSRRGQSGLGAPHVDITSARSWWPSCAEGMGALGVWLSVVNTAKGASSLCDVWVGRCRTWASSMLVGPGSYVLSGGGIWRSNAPGPGALSSTVAPTGTSNTTGADGVPWIYLGTQTAEDTNGAIYAFGSPRYDPNGYIAAVANLATASGYDEIGAIVSIGQSDHAYGSTRAQYAQAMVNVATHLSGLGMRVWLGMTCYMAGDPARETSFQTVLLPGRLDALGKLSSNRKVSVGADLRTSLGVLVAGAADQTVGLQSDELHLTSAGYEAAGRIWASAFAAGGWALT